MLAAVPTDGGLLFGEIKMATKIYTVDVIDKVTGSLIERSSSKATCSEGAVLSFCSRSEKYRNHLKEVFDSAISYRIDAYLS